MIFVIFMRLLSISDVKRIASACLNFRKKNPVETGYSSTPVFTNTGFSAVV